MWFRRGVLEHTNEYGWRPGDRSFEKQRTGRGVVGGHACGRILEWMVCGPKDPQRCAELRHGGIVDLGAGCEVGTHAGSAVSSGYDERVA